MNVGGIEYQIGKLSPREQLHVVRRLGPFASEIAASIGSLKSTPIANEDAATVAFLTPITRAIAGMPQADVDYILDTCLGTVSRDIGNGKFAPVKVKGSADLMYSDIKLPEMMQLVVGVVVENLGSFFPDPVIPGSAAPTPA